MKNVLRMQRTTARLAFTGGTAAIAAVLAGAGVASAVGTWPANYVDSGSINQQATGGMVLYAPNGTTVVTTGSTTTPIDQVLGQAVSANGTPPATYSSSAFQGTQFALYIPSAGTSDAWQGTPVGNFTVVTDPSQAPYFSFAGDDTDTIASLITAAGTPEANGFIEFRLELSDNSALTEPTYYTLELQVTGTTFTVVNPATVVTTPPNLPEVPMSVMLPIAGFVAAGGTVMVRRRQQKKAVAA